MEGCSSSSFQGCSFSCKAKVTPSLVTLSFKMTQVLLVLCLSLGLTNQVTSLSLGPPPGSRGIIDFRYPDIIVDPLPACPFEGVFPHPRNCSWFYRCHLHVQEFFHRDYFECALGTFFNDALDLCTWSGSSTCNDALLSSCTDCSVTSSSCAQYSVCPDGSLFSNVNLTLCSSADLVCQPCGSSKPFCPTGQYYNTKNAQCYPSPGDMKCPPPGSVPLTTYPEGPGPTIRPLPNPQITAGTQGSPSPPITGTPSPPSPATVSTPSPPPQATESTPSPPSLTTASTLSPPTPTTEVPCNDCYISTSRCQPFNVCPSQGPNITLTLCPISSNVCSPCGSETPACPTGEFYSMEDANCYPPPDSPSMQCPAPTTAAPSELNIADTASNPIQCSVTNIIPKNDWIKKKYCNSFPLCTPSGGFMSLAELCTNYYICIQKSGVWNAQLTQCPPTLLYSFAEDLCVPTPTNICGG